MLGHGLFFELPVTPLYAVDAAHLQNEHLTFRTGRTTIRPNISQEVFSMKPLQYTIVRAAPEDACLLYTSRCV